MARKPQWENDDIAESMQYVSRIAEKQNEFAYLEDFEALDRKYQTPGKVPSKKNETTVNLDGYFGQNSQNQFMSMTRKKSIVPEISAPRSSISRETPGNDFI